MRSFQTPQISLLDGNTIPQLGLGTFLMQSDECEQVVRDAVSLGYRHIDTATVYRNEKEVGRAIKSSDLDREEMFVTTKLWNEEQTDPQGGFDRSLQRLGLDYVDLYLLHWPLPLRDTALEAWRGIIKIGESGRARSIGVCNFEIEHLKRFIGETGVVPSVNQIELHPEHQRAELVTYCKEQGIIVESWGPLAQNKSNLLHKSAITSAAQAHGKTPGQIVLRWHIERGNVVIPKTATMSRLHENIDIFDFTLTRTEHEAIDALEQGTNYGPDPFTYDG